MPAEDMLREAAGQLKEIITARNVMGEAIDMGNRMIIPVTRFGIGFGAGGGIGAGNNGNAGGAGGGIEPIAVIITDKELSGVEGIQIMRNQLSYLSQIASNTKFLISIDSKLDALKTDSLRATGLNI